MASAQSPSFAQLLTSAVQRPPTQRSPFWQSAADAQPSTEQQPSRQAPEEQSAVVEQAAVAQELPASTFGAVQI
jgi:hypothetical protein